MIERTFLPDKHKSPQRLPYKAATRHSHGRRGKETGMKLNKGQSGFTLLELVVGIGIAVVVVGATSAAIMTIMKLTPWNNNMAIALRQVQNAGYWISRDVQMSENITVGNSNPEFLTLTVPEGNHDTGQVVDKTVVYEFQDMTGGLSRLIRDDAGAQIMIAEYISTNGTSATYCAHCTDNCTLNFTITAISGNINITRDYKALQRVPAP